MRTDNIKKLTLEDIADICSLFTLYQNNYSIKDFDIIFKDSYLGASYFKDKFEENDRKLDRFFNYLDAENKQLLIDFIFNTKYPNDIVKNREERDFFQSEEFNALKDRYK